MRVVDVAHLTKVYGHRLNRVTALNDLSFHIEAGEFVGIMGPSGAGKSTLLNMIATIDQPTSGTLTVAGRELTRLGDSEAAKYRREDLGFIFQAFNLVPDLTVADNITLPQTFVPPVPKDLDQRLMRFAKMLGLVPLLKRYPEQLSLGQRQRVAAARAMIGHPDLILADEPTGSLDSMAATELLQYLAKLNLEEDVTIMMVTHDAFTASFCNRIIFIRDGAYFAEVTRHSSRQAFFNSIIDMEATINGGIAVGRLIRTSLRRHRTVNRLYVLMAALMIAMLYAMLALIQDDALLARTVAMNDVTAAVPALLVGVLVVILLFAIVFLLYMNSILIERRTSNLRLYRRLGMPVSRIGLGLLGESLILGTGAIVLGIGGGWGFSKFLAMMLLRIMGVHRVVGLLWAPRAAAELTLLFLVVYAVLGLINAIYAGNVTMTTAASAPARVRRFQASGWHAVLAWLGAALLASSYLAAFNLVHLTYAMAQRYQGGGVWTLFAVPVIGIVSLYLVFKFSLPAFMNWLQRRPWVRQDATRLLTVTNLNKRLLRNVHSLFLTTVLATVTITVLGSGAMLYQFGQRSVTRSVALDMVASSTGVKSTFGKFKPQAIKRSAVLPTKLAAGRLNEPTHGTGDGDETIYNVLALSDYARIRRMQPTLPKLSLQSGQAAMILFGRTLYRHTWLGKRQHWSLTLTRTRERFAVTRVTGAFPLGDDGYFDRALVVPDRAYADLHALLDSLTGYTLHHTPAANAAVKRLDGAVSEDYVSGSAAVLAGKKAPRVKKVAGATDFSRRAVQFKAPLMAEMNVVFGMALFIVIILGVVFIVATASILLIKQLMLAAEDHQARTVLRQLGMPRPTERRVASAQTGMVFALPLVFGAVNSGLIIHYLSMFLNDPGVLLVIAIIMLYVLVYLAFGILTVKLTERP